MIHRTARALLFCALGVALFAALLVALIAFQLVREIADEVRASRNENRTKGGTLHHPKNVKLWDSTTLLRARLAVHAALEGVNSEQAQREIAYARRTSEFVLVRRSA